MVKGGPVRRREYLDDLLVAVAPRYQAVRSDYDRVLRHRNALLKGGVRDEEARTTLEVFDEQLVTAGAELVRGRLRLTERLSQPLEDAYRAVATDGSDVVTAYEAEWAEGILCSMDSIPDILHAGLSARRRQELDRGLTLVGPHRDDWRLALGGSGQGRESVFDSRTHASQGEQRSLALALRLAGHRLCTEVLDDPPVLLLDDVFSELDARRTEALVAHLPIGQTVLTTAGTLPVGVHPDQFLRVASGSIGPG
jgi:DNA replication and repair protein RecF